MKTGQASGTIRCTLARKPVVIAACRQTPIDWGWCQLRC
jgi:hypothetical protein